MPSVLIPLSFDKQNLSSIFIRSSKYDIFFENFNSFFVTMTLLNIRTSEGEILQVESEVAKLSNTISEMCENLNIDSKDSAVSRKLDSC